MDKADIIGILIGIATTPFLIMGFIWLALHGVQYWLHGIGYVFTTLFVK